MSPLVGTTYMRKVQGDNSASPTFKIEPVDAPPQRHGEKDGRARAWRGRGGAGESRLAPRSRPAAYAARDKKPAPWGHGVSPYIICGGRR